MNRASRFYLSLFLLALAAGCGHAGSPVLPGTPLGSPAEIEGGGATIAATFNITIPSGTRRAQTPALERQRFVVASTKSVAIAAFIAGTRRRVATKVANLSVTSRICKPARGKRVCTVIVPLPKTGRYRFVARTYDEAPTGGRIPSGAHQLAAGIAFADLNMTRTVRLVLGGVVAATSVASAGGTSFPAIDPLTLALTVEALDADNNIIVTDKYVDKSGGPVKITMSAGSTAGSTTTISPASFNRPQAAVTLVYSPGAMSSTQATNGFVTNVDATASNGAPKTGLVLTFKKPSMTTFVIPSPGGQEQIAVGPDRNLWFTLPSANAVGRTTTKGVITQFPSSLYAGEPGAIASDDGSLWFLGTSTNTINSVTTNGTIGQSFHPPTSGSSPTGITLGPDGNLWFTENAAGQVAVFNPKTQGFLEFPLSAPTVGPIGIADGPDGALWFTENNGNAIGRITTNGSSLSTFALPANFAPENIAAGSDGALWFTGNTQTLGRITTKGALTTYPLIGEGSAITQGPDGAIWFTLNTSYSGYVVRMSTSGIMTSYIVAGSNPRPAGIVTGPDGALWFVETSGNFVVRMQ